jgi:predicted aspartyl protease
MGDNKKATQSHITKTLIQILGKGFKHIRGKKLIRIKKLIKKDGNLSIMINEPKNTPKHVSVKGIIENEEISMLIDSGATKNIINQDLVEKLKLTTLEGNQLI